MRHLSCSLWARTRFRPPTLIAARGRSLATSLWAVRMCCRCSHRQRCSGRKALTSTSGRFTVASGRNVSPAGSRPTPLGSDSTIFTPTSYNAMRSRGYAHSREHACCPSPSRRDVLRSACATILKAFFDADYVLPHPVEATPDGSTLDPWKGTDLTLGNEIDKLANNIALGRDAAGVHYRSDSIHGLFVGEQQALGLLRDYSRTYNEHFDGFVVRKFSGDRVKITGGEVQRL